MGLPLLSCLTLWQVLALCHCPESLACKCIDALTPALELHEVYALLHAPTQSENVAAKARTVCSRWLSQHYGESWPEQTPESILDLEFPAFELLLQADDLKVRSGVAWTSTWARALVVVGMGA